MSSLTRSGVAYNLDESPHKLVIEYSDGNVLVYVFSSELYLNIFKRKLVDNRSKIIESLSKRFGFKIVNNVLADIKLYSMTEKRGFLIIGNESYRCQSTIELIGANLTQRN